MNANNKQEKNTEKSSKKSLFKKYELVVFFFITFVITWGFDLIGIIFIDYYYPFLIMGAFGPFIAALLVIYGTERSEGLKGFFQKFKKINGFKWLIFSVFIYGGGLLIGAWLITLFGGDIINPYQSTPFFTIILNISLIFFVTTFLTGGNEEPGWRGYALPALLKRFKPLWASIILGVIWAFWHIPTFFLPTIQSFIPFYLYFPHIIFLSIIFTWLYIRTEESVVYAIIFHGLINMLLGIVLDFLDITLNQFLLLIFIFLIIEACFSILLVFFEKEIFLKTAD
ncbi:MAG: membrane protein of unknown function [Promethearchaeota archaeon]|nr:MAG: membrane protein of unknown function [Candidatus Lokiarchaeota archaeon]